MRLINIEVFLERERMMSIGKRVERRTKVLDFHDDEATEYAILSHRWIDDTEVNYEEMIDLGKMDMQEQNEIRGRQGYKKILDTCKQTKEDGYKWVWIDTCCIDKRSSAELSEAINSMYRWYGNARACYAYLHDVDGPSFPTQQDEEKYRKSNGWPEWFSRGWTLQEMIAPSDVEFFNKDWQPIGNKKTLAKALESITRVPKHILADGLEGNRPCVAQIMSWAANRTTTRAEDRSYSLMGLLDVNMSMLYGEGKKAFHRLQLEIIRLSNDQSIFAWGWHRGDVGIGSVLADDPSFFEDCYEMELMDLRSFTRRRQPSILIDADHWGVFPVTNRGIQIWMRLCPYRGSKTLFAVDLPCQSHGRLVTITLVLWNSNYYRYPSLWRGAELEHPQFRQVYLRYHDTPNSAVTIEIDDSGLIENGFTAGSRAMKLKGPTGNTFPLTNANPFCNKAYSEGQGDNCFAVSFGQCFGLDWMFFGDFNADRFRPDHFDNAFTHGPDWALSLFMSSAPLEHDYDSCARVRIRHFRLPESTWVVRTYRAVWKRTKIRLRIEAFQDSSFRGGLDEWKAYDIEVSDFSARELLP